MTTGPHGRSFILRWYFPEGNFTETRSQYANEAISIELIIVFFFLVLVFLMVALLTFRNISAS